MGTLLYVVVALIATSLRALPEILAGRYPVGFDTTAYYPYYITNFSSVSPLEMLKVGPLFYLAMSAIYATTRFDVYLLLKVTGPIIYGCLAASFLYFLKSFMKFDERKSVIGTLVFILQPITLRISWDLFRNELGLITMFLAFGALGKRGRSGYFVVALLGVLTVLAHPLTAVLMLVGVLGLALNSRLRGETLENIAPFSVAFGLFFAWAFAFLLIPSAPDPRVIYLSPNPPASSSGFMANVFLDDFRFVGADYWKVATYVATLFLFSFVQLTPFVAKGVRKDPTILAMTVFLTIASFDVLVSPSHSLLEYWRWQFLLVIPFAIYATNGMQRLGLLFRGKRHYLIAILLVYSVVAVGYSSGKFSYVWNLGANSYVPVTMVESSISVPDIDNAISSLKWLSTNSQAKSFLLTDESFFSFALMTPGRNFTVVLQPGGPPFRNAVQTLAQYEPASLFFIYYTGTVVDGFQTVHSDGNISIFRYGSV